MFGLIPKDTKFFVMFKDLAKKIVEGAVLLKEMLENFDHKETYQKQIKDIEHQADNITHEIIKKLDQSFITPFDREDIYGLAMALDTILDLIDVSAQHIVLYRIDVIRPIAKQLGFVILQSCRAVEKAVSVLDAKVEYKHISEFCVEANSLENEADRLYREALRDLIDNEKDAIEFIKWKDVYATLETVTDKCEDAANVLESIVVKNA